MPLLWIAFTLSGAAALLAEQVFEKLLSTLVGATTPASAVVLAVYFAGLTTGALVYPRARRASWSPLVVYAVLEVAVAATCAGLAWKYGALVPAFAPLLRLGVGRPGLLTLLRGAVAAVWILPLTVPMGATFPAIVDAADRVARGRPASGARALSVLYAVNLAGAILAAFFGPFCVFPNAGMTGGLGLACGFDLVAATLALIVASRRRETASPTVSAARIAPGQSARLPPGLAAFAAFTGFLLFSLEVTWTHLACAVLGNSVYAFASMLGSVPVGLGAGSVLAAIVFPRDTQVPSWAPGGALLLGALVLVVVHAAWPSAPHLLLLLGQRTTSFMAAEASRFAIAAGLFVPPATVLGLAYPLLFRVENFPDVERGGAAGRIAGANAIGCIAGAIVTGFVVLPSLGSENTERALVVLAAIVGAGFVAKTSTARVRRIGAASAVIAIAAACLAPRWNRLALTLGENVYFRQDFSPYLVDLLSFHEDTLGGMTSVVVNHAEIPAPRVLLTNGKFQGDDRGQMPAQTAIALVPAQFVTHFDRALVLGLGTGRTAYVVHSMGFGAVDVAEISPGIVAAAREFFPHINGQVLDAPNVTLFLEDGRNVLLLRDTTYDLVTMELSSIWFAGATNLYSREFYELVRTRMRPGGIVQEWIQVHHIGAAELESVLSTMRDVFPYVTFFYVGNQGLAVASMEPQVVTPAFAQQLRATGSWRLLETRDPEEASAQLAHGLFLTAPEVDRLAANPAITHNTDGNRYLEYATPRYNYRSEDVRSANLAAMKAGF